MNWYVPICHFTNISNLESILQSNSLKADCFLDGQYVNSGNTDIKNRRKNIPIYIDNVYYGNVGEFVPFYFAPRSPMLFTQQINHNVKKEDIIYLVSDVCYYAQFGKWCFSDRNAAIRYANFYNKIELLTKIVDFELMHSTMWNDIEQYPDRKSRRMAEFLVYGSVGFEHIKWICVFDSNSYENVKHILAKYKVNIPVTINPDYYFLI